MSVSNHQAHRLPQDWKTWGANRCERSLQMEQSTFFFLCWHLCFVWKLSCPISFRQAFSLFFPKDSVGPPRTDVLPGFEWDEFVGSAEDRSDETHLHSLASLSIDSQNHLTVRFIMDFQSNGNLFQELWLQGGLEFVPCVWHVWDWAILKMKRPKDFEKRYC